MIKEGRKIAEVDILGFLRHHLLSVVTKGLLSLLKGGFNVPNNLILKILQESLGLAKDLASDVGDILNDSGGFRNGTVGIPLTIKDLRKVSRSATIPGKELRKLVCNLKRKYGRSLH